MGGVRPRCRLAGAFARKPRLRFTLDHPRQHQFQRPGGQRLPHFGRHGRGPEDGARLVLDPLEALVPAAGFVLLAAAAGTGGVAGELLVRHGLVLLRRPIMTGCGSGQLGQAVRPSCFFQALPRASAARMASATMSGRTSNGSLWMVSPFAVARFATCWSNAGGRSVKPISASVTGRPTSVAKCNTCSSTERG